MFSNYQLVKLVATVAVWVGVESWEQRTGMHSLAYIRSCLILIINVS